MKILIADHDLSVLNAVAHRLRAEGYAVTTTQTEEHALELLRADRPDLIISEVSMPLLSGISTEGLFRRFYRRIPVIVTAPHEMEQKILTSGLLEEEDVIFRPVNLSELLLRVASLRGSRLRMAS